MSTRNLYVVLGVPPTERSAGIRHAFRELSRRCHPDRAGEGGTRFFQELLDAHDVLSDPERRSSYDDALRHGAEIEAAERAPWTPSFEPAPTPEPLVPPRLSLFRDFEVTHPSADDVLDHLVRSATDPWRPKSQRVDALDLELHLTFAEAARGGVLALGVPVFYPCRVCQGAGTTVSIACPACDGQGIVEEEEEVHIPIPRFARDGAVLRVPLRGLGVHNLFLQVLLRVGA